MQKLKDKLINEGLCIGDKVIKVNGFLNHQIDVKLMDEIGEEIAKYYKDYEITKILTGEASGIAIALATSRALNYVPVLIGKKNKPITMTGKTYEAQSTSFTNGDTSNFVVSAEFITSDDKVLVVDDFLARGKSGHALCDIVKQSGAELIGYSAVFEKRSQGGYDIVKQYTENVHSLVVIDKMENGKITFIED